jgi:primase-polymerase (primpol)-like protein
MSAAIVIPACLEPLTHECRWLVWRREQRRGGRLAKVPYRANRPSSHASCKDPTTWCSFDTAMRAYTEGGVDGIAFALLGSNIVAFDVDHCRDAASGNLHEWARRLVERCGSYAEITPSQEGIRILGTGSNRKIHRKFKVEDGGGVENL